jgi:hypothetical protein
MYLYTSLHSANLLEYNKNSSLRLSFSFIGGNMKIFSLFISLFIFAISTPIFADDNNGPALDQAVINFKTWFNKDVAKQDVKSTAIKMEQDYYAAFKTCTPGNYKYVTFDPMYAMEKSPMITLASSKIMGFQNGKCIVTLDPNTPDVSQCQFSQESIDAIVNLDNANINGSITPDIASGAMKALKDCTP